MANREQRRLPKAKEQEHIRQAADMLKKMARKMAEENADMLLAASLIVAYEKFGIKTRINEFYQYVASEMAHADCATELKKRAKEVTGIDLMDIECKIEWEMKEYGLYRD